MIVPFSRSLVSWLGQPYPDDDTTATDFDCWVHGSLLAFQDSFNTV